MFPGRVKIRSDLVDVRIEIVSGRAETRSRKMSELSAHCGVPLTGALRKTASDGDPISSGGQIMSGIDPVGVGLTASNRCPKEVDKVSRVNQCGFEFEAAMLS